MAPAREGLEPSLRGLDLQPLVVPLYRNIDARRVNGPDEVREGLIRQVDAPVLWTQNIRHMREDGFDTFVEVGTGSVLSGLVKRIDRDAVCYQAGTVATVEKAIAELCG
jgi:[acyl-carrier-protein] S-malonyltransferase